MPIFILSQFATIYINNCWNIDIEPLTTYIWECLAFYCYDAKNKKWDIQIAILMRSIARRA